MAFQLMRSGGAMSLSHARRHRRDRLHFLNVAESSLAEVGYCIHVARRLGYISEAPEGGLEMEVKAVGDHVGGFIRHTRSALTSQVGIGSSNRVHHLTTRDPPDLPDPPDPQTCAIAPSPNRRRRPGRRTQRAGRRFRESRQPTAPGRASRREGLLAGGDPGVGGFPYMKTTIRM